MYDMAGNVWEWTSDWYDENYYKNSPSQNPKGPSSGEFKVLRGGSWVYAPQNLRSAARSDGTPTDRFRTLRVPVREDSIALGSWILGPWSLSERGSPRPLLLGERACRPMPTLQGASHVRIASDCDEGV